MNLKTKKILAREFLTLIIVATIGLITFLGTFPYNSFRNHQAKSLKEDILYKKVLIDSLSKTYRTKLNYQEWYFKQFNEQFDLGVFNTTEKWWNHNINLAKKDSINILWKKIWNKDKELIRFFKNIGFTKGDSLQNFILINTIDKVDIENKNNVEQIQKTIRELEAKQKIRAADILTYEEQLSFSITFLFFLASIFFGLRYLYYGVKWSLKTLNQN